MISRKIIPVVVVSVLLLTTFVQVVSQSPTNAQIVFASNLDGSYTLYAMNADGSNFHYLPIPSGELYVRDVTDATCSPDGRYILFEASGLWRVDVDGSNLTNIILTGLPTAPTWSPIGDKIAFSGISFSSEDRMGEIYTINADGSNLVQVTQNNYPDSDPTWSPDGQRIAFAYDDNGNRGIAVVNADGTNLVRLTQSANYDIFPSWSPDGTQIAFSRKSGSLYDIYTIQPDGSNLTQLTASSGNNTRPKWSPDGSQISFSSDRDGGENEIYLMNSDGSNEYRVRVDSYDANDLNVCWLVSPAPENGRLAFFSNRDGDWEIYSMNPDGTGLLKLTNNTVADRSPDGRVLAAQLRAARAIPDS